MPGKEPIGRVLRNYGFCVLVKSVAFLGSCRSCSEAWLLRAVDCEGGGLLGERGAASSAKLQERLENGKGRITKPLSEAEQ